MKQFLIFKLKNEFSDLKKLVFLQLAVFGSRSQIDPLDAESDQSILDDHVSRIFNAGCTDTPPSMSADFTARGAYHNNNTHRLANVSANTTSAFDTSRRSMNPATISGHSTLPGRTRTAAYPQYGEIQVKIDLTKL